MTARAAPILAIDTATPDGSVAVVRGEETLAEAGARVSTHSTGLLALVREVLDRAGVAPGDLDAVACGAGPGSFTGLRIGLATAKGLCWAAGKPLVLVSSLAALATNAPPAPRVVACIDARRREVFAGAFAWSGAGAPTPLEPEVVLRPSALAARLADAGRVLVGDGVRAYPELLAPFAIPGADPAVRAAAVGRLAALRRAHGERDDLAAAEPTYLRASDAEVGRRPPGE